MTILLGILVILDMGAVTVQDRDRTLRRHEKGALVLVQSWFGPGLLRMHFWDRYGL